MGLLYAALAGYFFGSLPFAYWFGILQHKNLLEEGSGNVGTTNAWRVLGPVPGAMVLVLDVCKGILAVALGEFLAKDATGGLLAGALAVWGHCYSIWLLGKGGKGIATGVGVLFAVQPVILLIALGLFLACAFLTRNRYRAASLAALTLPVLSVAVVPITAYLWFGFGVGIPVAIKNLPDWNRV
ncbi:MULTISPECIES: glycerol-3-phosphate acyltransferase [unclassified Meiothermus]|uniref:glycerol-3-phosphate acyltransferase n=1 Tax=unclassified Meiothermus TaxID=370471 RepID=UPI000D7C750D|nr:MULTISPECIES: glycerol-3-phosphate acyltransferase [unclassified Meiothermus]PZA07831.1 glycerol-3-phosphate acyltransferase [Meiothermus sp. Pnk-1]RYM38865.1 glycerol-3-phosphate acyltransferase [Meiothermus sp. PNK-Is4]